MISIPKHFQPHTATDRDFQEIAAAAEKSGIASVYTESNTIISFALSRQITNIDEDELLIEVEKYLNPPKIENSHTYTPVKEEDLDLEIPEVCGYQDVAFVVGAVAVSLLFYYFNT